MTTIQPAALPPVFLCPKGDTRMGTIYPTVPVARPAEDSWLADDSPDAIRADELFARQLDNDLSDDLYRLHEGLAAKSGEEALAAIGEVGPAIAGLKERYLGQAIGSRQKGLIEPLIDQRIEHTGRLVGSLAKRATAELDDQVTAGRLAGFSRDASAAWDDPERLRLYGRAAVQELRYQGERRGWTAADADAKIRFALSDLYAGAIETAIGRDVDGAQRLLDHAREVIAPDRQSVIDRRLAAAREDARVREVDRALAAIPLDPRAPPTAEAFTDLAAALAGDEASDAMKARLSQVAAFALRRAERQWQKKQGEAAVAAHRWLGENPDTPTELMPGGVREWLSPEQQRGLRTAVEAGRVQTDGDLFDRLDRLAVYKPGEFAGLDLSLHRLRLDDDDFEFFARIGTSIAEGVPDATFVRHRRLHIAADTALSSAGIDVDGTQANGIRSALRDELRDFEVLEGRTPSGHDIDSFVARAIGGLSPSEPSAPVGGFDPSHVIPVNNRGGGSGGGGGGSPRSSTQPGRQPGPGHNQGPSPTGRGTPSSTSTPGQPAAHPAPDQAGPRAAAEQPAPESKLSNNQRGELEALRRSLEELSPTHESLKRFSNPNFQPIPDDVIALRTEIQTIVEPKVRAVRQDLVAKSWSPQRAQVRQMTEPTDLQAEFEKLKTVGKRIYSLSGAFRKGGKGEWYELPGNEPGKPAIRISFRMARDMSNKAENYPETIATLEITIPRQKSLKFHYNTKR
jgi:hypothetical protein